MSPQAILLALSSVALGVALAPGIALAQCGSLTNPCCEQSPTLSAGCSDQTCCETVCAFDAYCCDTYWDSLCVAGAFTACPGVCGGATCVLATPNQFEIEACGEGLNDSCASIVELPLAPGSAVQGTLGTDPFGGGGRDIDWYRLTLFGTTNVSLSLRSASAPAAVAIVDPNCTGTLFAGTEGGCPADLSVCLEGGDYLVVVYATTFEGFTCGSLDTRYTLEVSGAAGCSTQPPANDDCGTATVASTGANPFNNIYATTEVSQPSCGFEGFAFLKDVWFRFTAEESGVYEIGTCLAPSSLDTGIEIWSGCPASDGAVVACDDDGCTISSFARTSRLVYPLEGGQTIWIRLAGFDGAAGIGDLVINRFGGAFNCGDPAGNDCCVAGVQAGCSDADCCSLVCTADDLCCFFSWDASCAALAEVLCAESCADKCVLAPETMFEEEPCGADTNGGCNGGPAEPVSIGDTVRGTFWASNAERDADWYLLSLSKPTEVTISIRSELDCFAAFVGFDCELIATTSGDCPGTATRCLAPGSYYVVALPVVFGGIPCGGPLGNDYTIEIIGNSTCDTAPPENDFCIDAAVATVGVNAVDTTFATTEVFTVTCGFGEFPFAKDVWWSFTATETAIHTFETCGSGPSFDSGIDLWDNCPAKGGVVLACNDDGFVCQSFASSVSHPLVAGQTVLVRVGGWQGASGTADLRIRAGCCGGACDACDEPTVVGLGANEFTNVSTLCYFEDGCGLFSGFTSNVNFYQFTPPQTGSYSISTCDSAPFDTVISVRTGCNGTTLACNDNAAFTQCNEGTSRIASVALQGGQPYIITIGGNEFFGLGTGTLTILPVGETNGPANDECASSTPVTVGLNSFTNVGATGSVNTFCGDLSRSVWYAYTATGNGPVTISFCAADGGSTAVNTVINVIDECGGLVVACSNDSCGTQSKVTFPASCGERFKIAIGTRPGSLPASGTGTFRISQAGSCGPSCPADLNGDGSVGAQDLAALLSAWDGPAGDLNGDGTTNAQDLAVVLSTWGPCAP